MRAQAKMLLDIARKVTRLVRTLRSDQRGVSAIEFALFGGMLSVSLLNVVDLSIYIYQRMELENATQMAAQAAWKTCDPAQGYLPATINCPGLTTAITNAVHSTALGTRVSLQSGSPAENYYCLDSSGTLQPVAKVTSTKPTDCSAVGMPSLQPTDYIQVTAVFSYTPLFKGMTVVSILTTPITKTAMMRLD